MLRTKGLLLVCFFFTSFCLAAAVESDTELRAEVEMLKQRVEQLEALVRALQGDLNGPESEPSVPAGGGNGAKPPTQSSRSSGGLQATWKEGLQLNSEDGDFSLKIGGRIQNDWSFYSADDSINTLLPLIDGTEFRRARVFVSGTIYDNVEYKAEYDFAGAEAAFKDVYVGFKGIPVFGQLRVGHQKEPFSLEELTSSRHITFLERGSLNALVPSRNTGLLFQNTQLNGRLNYAAGVFRDVGDSGDGSSEGSYNFSGRLTGLPWYEDGGRRLLHLGVAYSRQNPSPDILRFRGRPESHLAPRFVNTGFFGGRSYDLIGLEGAVVSGPVSVQSEYVRAAADGPAVNDPSFNGFYVQASWFPTGEHRVYKTSSAAFDRVKPRLNFLRSERGERGKGAWELAARYSFLDLDDGLVQGGRMDNFTFGVNWYLNPNTKIMWNYVFSELEDRGDANIFQTRFQVDF